MLAHNFVVTEVNNNLTGSIAKFARRFIKALSLQAVNHEQVSVFNVVIPEKTMRSFDFISTKIKIEQDVQKNNSRILRCYFF
jgi:hypothetical protein